MRTNCNILQQTSPNNLPTITSIKHNHYQQNNSPYYKPNTITNSTSKSHYLKKTTTIKLTNYQHNHAKKRRRTIHNKSYHNNTLLLRCGDIESNQEPKLPLLLNHPQSHQEKHKTYFYKNTTQINIEYAHIFESFEPYLNQIQTNTTNQQLTQFCMNNHHCPKNHLFYAILITLAPTSTQCNQLIGENSTQWTTNLIRKLTNNTNPLPSSPHILQKFHPEYPHITKPSDIIQKALYSFITTERPYLETLQQEFPYLPKNMTIEALKCLHPIPNFTLPNPIQNHPILNP
jgi:hypothetical protein